MAAAAAQASLLSTLLADIVAVPSDGDPAVTSVSSDSRTVARGGLFLAAPGATADGRLFVDEALRRGAAAVVFEAAGWPQAPELPVPSYAVPDLYKHIGVIADRFYGSPSRRLKVVAVTGTNGKTTVTHLTAQALTALGRPCGVLGTLGCGFVDHLDVCGLTTPDAIRVQHYLAKLVAAGAQYACLETSSHALAQARVDGTAVDTAVFTNLSHDHLDYHGDMTEYARAKSRLFCFPGLRAAVINADDVLGQRLLSTTGAERVWSYAGERADVTLEAADMGLFGMRLTLATPAGAIECAPALFGRFNVNNVLAVVATLLALGIEARDIATAMAKLSPVPGRMEMFPGGDGVPTVAVDYAHTPDALAKALRALREQTAGRLWCVFGCGGDRDHAKRPIMGRIADRLADEIVITDDNPRREPAEQIVNDIKTGMRRNVAVIHDRAQAIRWALEHAAAADTVLVAGKGHEDTQEIGDRRLPFDDRTVVTSYRRKAG